MNFAGLDIGGAHIKVATAEGLARQISFPIWKDPDQLKVVLSEIESSFRPPVRLGITMTAELADCFDHRKRGVKFIVDAVTQTMDRHAPLFYQLDGNMCSALVAIDQWQTVAASNWHALAWHAFQLSDFDSGFLVDIGSTTCDIVPVREGRPVISNQSDFDRLSNRQLFYAGVGRTPVCSILEEIELTDGSVSVAREFFATMADVFVWLGDVAPDSDFTETADGRNLNRDHAGQRLSRQVCRDHEHNSESVRLIDAISHQAKSKMIEGVSEAISQVVSQHFDLPLFFRVSGGGDWLAQEAIEHAFRAQTPTEPISISLMAADRIQSQAAPALAVALKRQQIFQGSSEWHHE